MAKASFTTSIITKKHFLMERNYIYWNILNVLYYHNSCSSKTLFFGHYFLHIITEFSHHCHYLNPLYLALPNPQILLVFQEHSPNHSVTIVEVHFIQKVTSFNYAEWGEKKLVAKVKYCMIPPI